MTSVTLSEALRRFLLVDRSEQTRVTYSRFLNCFVADIGPARPINLITPEDIHAYISAMRERDTKYASHPSRPTQKGKLSPVTIYKNAKMIKTFFLWCARTGLIEVSPASGISNGRPVRPLGMGKAATDEELEALLAASRFAPRDHALLRVLAQSGCRAAEAASLQIHNLDLKQMHALVDGKGDIRRVIYFDQITVEAIEAWLDERPEVDHDIVFVSAYDGSPLTSGAISQVIRRLSKKSRLKRSLGPHSLRHRVGLKMARAHVAPRVTQHYLGHRDIKITLTYYQDVDESDLQKAGELLTL